MTVVVVTNRIIFTISRLFYLFHFYVILFFPTNFLRESHVISFEIILSNILLWIILFCDRNNLLRIVGNNHGADWIKCWAGILFEQTFEYLTVIFKSWIWFKRNHLSFSVDSWLIVTTCWWYRLVLIDIRVLRFIIIIISQSSTTEFVSLRT